MDRHKHPLALVVIIVLGAALFAGCTGPDYDPVEQEGKKTIKVPSGKGVEYKLYMEEGDELRYEWNAKRPIFYDFHGDREGADPDDFTSHKTGTLVSDGGTFVAPFTGRHGWYWQNDHADEAVVGLETSGTYAVVGFV